MCRDKLERVPVEIGLEKLEKEIIRSLIKDKKEAQLFRYVEALLTVAYHRDRTYGYNDADDE